MSGVVIPTGKERRRKGVLNRLRRAVFGLLLSCGANHAQAFDLMAPFDRDRDGATVTDSLTDAAKRHLHLFIEMRNFDDVPGRSLFIGQTYRETLSGTGQSLATAAASGSWGMMFSADEISRLREGGGMDFQVPALGKLRLNYRSGDDTDAPWLIARGWSLGGSFEQTQVLEGAHIRGGVDFVPQLVLDLSALTPINDRFNLTFQYAHWHNRDGMATDDRQPQLLLKWSF